MDRDSFDLHDGSYLDLYYELIYCNFHKSGLDIQNNIAMKVSQYINNMLSI